MVNFSVIIPVHNVEGYLRQCLMSAVDQVVDGDEIIVVEDHSTDRSHDIAVELAEANPQIRILRPEANIGLGPARNLGMGEASSDYVLFLDSDDYYYPGALDAIRERCDTTDADLVIFDYERLYWNDRRSRNILARLFADRPDVLTLADDPELLKLLNVAWNKAYKREFLETTALTFPHGYYEDIPFTYPVMGLASSIAMLDRVCMAYRQRRGGSILRSSGERHFELIDQLERMFEIVAEHPELQPFATDFWMRGGSHVLAVLAAGESRLPASRRADFFHKSAAVLGPTAPPMFELPMTDLGLKYRLVAMNNYPAFQALKVVNGQRIRARKLKKKFGPKLRGSQRCKAHQAERILCCLYVALEPPPIWQPPGHLPGAVGARTPHQGHVDHQQTVYRRRRLPASRRCREPRSPGALPLRQVLCERRQLPERVGETARSNRASNPTRHPTEVHGARPSGLPGGCQQDVVRMAPQTRRPLGLQPVVQPLLDRGLAKGISRRPRHP